MNPAQPTTRTRPVASVFIRAFLSRKTIGPTLAYLGTVMKDFFFLQFSVKFGLKEIPIINVDHPLDRTVPFTPGLVTVYLDFVAFWIRPLDYIGSRFGRKKQAEYTVAFLRIVRRCYQDAAQVYRFRMTTTQRSAGFKTSAKMNAPFWRPISTALTKSACTGS